MPILNLFLRVSDCGRLLPISKSCTIEGLANPNGDWKGALGRLPPRFIGLASDTGGVLSAIVQLFGESFQSHSYNCQAIQRYKPNWSNALYQVPPDMGKVCYSSSSC